MFPLTATHNATLPSLRFGTCLVFKSKIACSCPRHKTIYKYCYDPDIFYDLLYNILSVYSYNSYIMGLVWVEIATECIVSLNIVGLGEQSFSAFQLFWAFFPFQGYLFHSVFSLNLYQKRTFSTRKVFVEEKTVLISFFSKLGICFYILNTRILYYLKSLKHQNCFYMAILKYNFYVSQISIHTKFQLPILFCT